MKMKKITIASLAIGTMLSITACSTSTDQGKEMKKEQTNAKEDAKTTSADETSTTKDEGKETNTTTTGKSGNDQTSSKGTTDKEATSKETNAKTTDQTTNGKTSNKDTTATTPKQKLNVKTNVKEVVQLIESLDKQLAANPKLDTVNKLGKQINEKWDVVEKELETAHPTDYKTIGQSIYPLIVATEKQKIDVKRIKSLTTKSKQDLNQLINKLS
ncbi:hypothetical protein QUF99_17540 [Bacillus sp. DX4.1]|uniref:hypothetical protein n=1 Tax=Bacillus sp. DX4.1 TaxID=3055867 RepID=UPI0025A1FF0A|nr:hypothetical protein [Bacillus sp. DX4.1]MDM5189053.1 hypothetical protein [Bacillus sp. DX4.1]